MANPKSDGTFFKPNFAITEVNPSKNIDATAYKIQVGIFKNLK
jgi:hypothetical protein